MRWPIVMLACGLAVTGCSTAPEEPAAPPPPPAKAELVRWAETACAQAKRIDELRGSFREVEKSLTSKESPFTARYAASDYVGSAVPSIESARTTLDGLAPSGIRSADAHIDEVVQALDAVAKRLPDTGAATMTGPIEQQVAMARDVAATLQRLEAQQPKLTKLANRVPALVSSYNVAPSCSPATQRDKRLRTLVAWSSVMCDSSKAARELETDPFANPLLNDPRFGQLVGFELGDYITSARQSVEDIAGKLRSVPRTGIKVADDAVAGFLSSVDAALATLPSSQTSVSDLAMSPAEQLRPQAIQVANQLKSIKPTDLAAVVEGNVELDTAHALAPACAPPGAPVNQLPPAANGTDLAACQSGNCEIQVNGSAVITVQGVRYDVMVADSSVTITSGTTVMQLAGPGGTASFAGEATTTFEVSGSVDASAVLKLSTA